MVQVRKNLLKALHVVSTLFFALSVCYLLIISVHRAGGSWRVITPISAYSLPLIFLVVLWYLFAVYRGIARDQKIEIEHPLTTTPIYQFFYNVTPLLGAMVGFIAGWGGVSTGNLALLMTGGTVFATFLVWIFVDPFSGTVEMLLPASRKHRQQRQACARAAYRKQVEARESLLKEVEKIEQMQWKHWDEMLMPLADELADLVSANGRDTDACRIQVIDIGVYLWQCGGLECMRYIHSAALNICRDRRGSADEIDCISLWWDGIGNWRSQYTQTLAMA